MFKKLRQFVNLNKKSNDVTNKFVSVFMKKITTSTVRRNKTATYYSLRGTKMDTIELVEFINYCSRYGKIIDRDKVAKLLKLDR